MWYIWLIIALAFLILEMITVGFLVFWVGISGLLTMLLSLFVSNVTIQTAFFVITSCILILLTKPFVNKFLNKNATIATNMYSVLNKKGIVISDSVSSEKIGQVKIGNEIWSAISVGEAPITKGSEVTVLKIDGVKVIVTPSNVIV